MAKKRNVGLEIALSLGGGACERSPFLSRTQRAGLIKTTRLALRGPQPTGQPAAPMTVRGQGVYALLCGHRSR
jgi:hypothetical protein